MLRSNIQSTFVTVTTAATMLERFEKFTISYTGYASLVCLGTRNLVPE